MELRQTEVLIIGGGPGGYVAAIRAAQLGKSVTLVEGSGLGGTCLNVGCIPSKALIDVAATYHRLAGEAARGIKVNTVELDFPTVQSWKQGVVDRLSGGITQLLQARGVQVITGHATFTGAHEAQVQGATGSETIRFESAIIATGSESLHLPELPESNNIVDSTGALALTELPDHLVVVGGGYIGLELGIAFRKLGSQVTVVEMAERLLPSLDPDLVQVLRRSLDRLGIKVHLGSRVTGAHETAGTVELMLHTPSGEVTLAAEKVLVAAGRRPRTAGLGLDQAGIQLTDRGFIQVDASMRTTAPHIFAVGDVVGPPFLAHKASREGLIAAENTAGENAVLDVRGMPAVVFTDPEIAVVGLTEAEARANYAEVRVAKFPFAASGRALATNQPEGFAKVIADADGTVLGAQIVGPEASALLGEAGLAVEMGANLEDIALTVHAHPTLPEALMEAAEAALGRPLHMLR